MRQCGTISIGPILALILLVNGTSARATTLLFNQVGTYMGYGYGLYQWDNLTTDLQAAFGASNITVSNTPLTDLATLMTFDRLWVTFRFSELSEVEQANISAYIAAGHRVVIIGEAYAVTEWNVSVMRTVGGTYLNE